MEYQDERGRYEISYSQELQKQDIRLKKAIIILGLIGLVVLIMILVMLYLLQMRDGHLGYVIKNIVCRG